MVGCATGFPYDRPDKIEKGLTDTNDVHRLSVHENILVGGILNLPEFILAMCP